MSQADFEAAAASVKAFTQRPTNEELLQLYALYKQVRISSSIASASRLTRSSRLTRVTTPPVR